MTRDDLARTLRGAYTVWYRDVLSLVRDKARLGSSLFMSVIFLVGIGFGLGGVIGKVGATSGVGAGTAGVPYVQFVFPAMLVMTALFAAMQSTLSIVWDREFGFMRKILVAPISRTSVALGKVAGGVTVATIQVAIMMLAMPLIGFGFHPLTYLWMLLLVILFSAVMTALGILIAARQKSTQAFQMINMFVMMPITLLTLGSFLPSFGKGVLATVFKAVSQINPASYAVDALRQISLGSRLPLAMSIHSAIIDSLILLVLFVVFAAPGVLLFNKQD